MPERDKSSEPSRVERTYALFDVRNYAPGSPGSLIVAG